MSFLSLCTLPAAPPRPIVRVFTLISRKVRKLPFKLKGGIFGIPDMGIYKSATPIPNGIAAGFERKFPKRRKMSDLTLVSREGRRFCVTKVAARGQSGLLNACLECDDEDEMVLERVEGAIGSRLFTYSHTHLTNLLVGPKEMYWKLLLLS